MSASLLAHQSLVAHQGGWDEILLIAVPVLLIIGALRVAKRRVEASASTSEVSEDGSNPNAGRPPDRPSERQ